MRKNVAVGALKGINVPKNGKPRTRKSWWKLSNVHNGKRKTVREGKEECEKLCARESMEEEREAAAAGACVCCQGERLFVSVCVSEFRSAAEC